MGIEGREVIGVALREQGSGLEGGGVVEGVELGEVVDDGVGAGVGDGVGDGVGVGEGVDDAAQLFSVRPPPQAQQ